MRQETYSAIVAPPVGAADNELPSVVIDYLHRLRRLPVGAWCDAARALYEAEQHSRTQPGPESIEAAHASLRRVVAGMPGLAVQTQRRVQNMADVAQTCLHIADASRMRRAAVTAALALAAREMLGERVFERLYAPFEPFIPLSDLVAGAGEHALLA